MMCNNTSQRNEVARLANLMQVAADNEQPVTISMTLTVFNGIVEYRVQQAIDAYKESQERERRENAQGDLLTPKEAKAMLHVSDATLWRYATKDGLLTRKQLGGKVYYSRKEIKKLMEG